MAGIFILHARKISTFNPQVWIPKISIFTLTLKITNHFGIIKSILQINYNCTITFRHLQ